jgi:hypothetical protein
MSRRDAVARFPDLDAAEEAVQALLAAHIPADAISVMGRAEEGLETRSLDYENGAIPGALVGGTWGALATLLGATLTATPLGLAAMPISAIVAGGAGGTVAGGLVGLAWWRQTAETHRDDFDDERSVWVAVHHETMADRAEEVLREQSPSAVMRVEPSEV